MPKSSISIHGSCLSRDIFSYVPNNKIIINNYIARQSILSSISNPLNCNLENIGLESKFQNDMVLCDLNKLIFSRLIENKSKFFIIDCIDERFNLINCNNSLFTYSSEISKSKILNTLNYTIIKKTDIDYNIIEEAVYKYIHEILKIFKEEDIIIHEVYYSNKFIDVDGNIKNFNSKIINSNDIYNNLLYSFYSCIKNLLPNSFVINKSTEYVADINNKWGLSPFHYEEKYYKDVYNIFINIFN